MADFFSSYLLPTSPPPGASLAPSGLEGEGGELAADTQDTASPAGGWIDEFSFMEGALLARAARGSLAPLSSVSAVSGGDSLSAPTLAVS